MSGAASCREIRNSLGVYVLGAIDPAERAQVDEHLPTCADCREELASLATHGTTLVLHLAVQRIEQVVADLMPHYGRDCPAAVVASASQPGCSSARLITVRPGAALGAVAISSAPAR